MTTVHHIRQDKVDLVLNILTAGKRPGTRRFQLRRLAVEMGTPMLNKSSIQYGSIARCSKS